MMAKIPTLETNRLRLRPHRPGDLQACASMWGDPAVTRYIGGRPFTQEEVWARLLRYAGHWKWMGFGFWLLEERVSGQFVGEIGLADFKRDMQPPICEGPEAGWVLASNAHGKGYATEALRAVTEWNDAQAEERSMTCMIHPENTASIRVASKCGFDETRRALYKGQATAVFIRPSQRALAAVQRYH